MTATAHMIRDAAADAWRGEESRARHLMITADGKRLEAIAEDAAPGTVCYAEGGRPVLTRCRVTLDGDLELVEDHGSSRRWDPSQDFQLTDRAGDQFRELRTKLSAIDPRKFRGGAVACGDGESRTPAQDAETTRAVVRRYGTDDLQRLRMVVALCPEATRTVSRLAAADDMMDLFIGSELIAQATDFHRVEHRRPYFRELFPMRNLNAPGALAYEAHHFDRRGRAEHTQDFSGRAPTATITRKPILRPLAWIRSGMRWSWLELQRWAQARKNGAPLPDFVSEQRDAAREACLELENLDLVFGNEALEIHGLLSAQALTGIPRTGPVTNLVDLTTGEEKVQAVLAGASRIFETEHEQGPFVIALPTREYLHIATATYDSTNDSNESVLEVVLRRGKAIGVSAIVRMPELGFSQVVKDYLEALGYKDPLLSIYAGGIGGKSVQLTFTRDPRKLRGITGQDFMQFPPDRTSVETHVQVALSTGGIEVPFPKAADITIYDDPAP